MNNAGLAPSGLLTGCGKLGLFINHHWNLPYGADFKITAGCSKRPSRKATASEEARRYGPHFV
jgi:hypothetical protein